MEERYSFDIALGIIYFLQELVPREQNQKRKEKKQRVLARKLAMLPKLFPQFISHIPDEEQVRRLLARHFTQREDEAMIFLIDLAFADPFAPYNLKFKHEDFEHILNKLAILVSLTAEDAQRIRQSYQEAHLSQWRWRWKMLLILSLVGLILLLTSRGIIFLIRQSIRGTWGTFNSIKPEYGLSEFGGRSLAIFSPQLAGGLWLLTTDEKISVGPLGDYRPLWLFELLGSAGMQQELVKLQVTYKEVMLNAQPEQAQVTSAALKGWQDKFEKRLEEEQSLNESRSPRIKETKDILFHLERSVKWIEQHEQH